MEVKNPWDRGPEPWIHIRNGMPPEAVILETRSETGMEQDLIHRHGMWWFTDMSASVHYSPILWRKKNAEAE